MNSRFFPSSNILSHSFNKSSSALKVIPNSGDQSAAHVGKDPADNPDSFAGTPQLVGPAAIHSEVLNSWKEIATYLGRGVRTVQRWEAELQLPVRRPRGKNRSAVMAFRTELDQWLSRTPLACDNKESENKESENNGSGDALVAIAHDMRELAVELFAAANSQTPSEGEKLVEIAEGIVHRLDLLMNRNSEPNHFERNSPDVRTLIADRQEAV